jgi:Flp pilus assembly protein TadG
MMRKLDQRGVAALEFCVVGAILFVLMFVIVDLGRYAITKQSLQALANAGARKMMIACYTPAVISNTSPSGCTADYLSSSEKQAAAPFLYSRDVDDPGPTVSTTSGAAVLTVTASKPITTLTPIWGGALSTPSASTSVPF